MSLPTWLKPFAGGALVGAVALAIIGFNWGGWTLRHTAVDMADVMAREQMVAAMLPICLEQAKTDPKFSETMATMKGARSFERDAVLVAAGWATMPGTTDANRFVVTACVEKLLTAS